MKFSWYEKLIWNNYNGQDEHFMHFCYFIKLRCGVVLIYMCILLILYLISKAGLLVVFLLLRRNAKIRNQYNQIPKPTQVTILESDKKHHIQESQEVSPFQAGDHKAARNRQDSMTDTNNKRSTALEQSLKIHCSKYLKEHYVFCH